MHQHIRVIAVAHHITSITGQHQYHLAGIDTHRLAAQRVQLGHAQGDSAYLQTLEPVRRLDGKAVVARPGHL